MRRRLLATTGTILALSLGVAACSQEVEPTVAPPTTSAEASTEPTTSEATTTPPTPDVPKPDPADFPGKDEQTEEGAQQAVRYYWAMLHWGYQSGESEDFDKLFSGDCKNCALNSEEIANSEGDREWWKTHELIAGELISVKSESFDYEIRYTFTLEEAKKGAGGESEVRLYETGSGVDWVGGKWVVGGVNFEVTDV